MAVRERARHRPRHRPQPALPLGASPTTSTCRTGSTSWGRWPHRSSAARTCPWSSSSRAPRSTRGARRSSASSSGPCSGSVLATVFVHSRLLERAFVPYVVASQTIPIVALAPMIVFALRPERDLGRHHRDLPDVLPGDDRDDPRPPLARPARPRADALVRAPDAGRSTARCACPHRCRTCSPP